MNGVGFGLVVGAACTLIVVLISGAISDVNRSSGCEKATQEECVYVGYLSESQVEMLKHKNKAEKEENDAKH